MFQCNEDSQRRKVLGLCQNIDKIVGIYEEQMNNFEMNQNQNSDKIPINE